MEAPGRRPGVKADLLPWSLRVSFYPVPSRPAIAGVEVPGADQGAARAVMVAVPVSALVWPVRAGSGGDGRSALLVAGASADHGGRAGGVVHGGGDRARGAAPGRAGPSAGPAV